MSRLIQVVFVPLVGAIIMALISGCTGDLFTPIQIQSILNAHNAGRRAVVPGASNMEFMNWDYGQADQANSWVMQCNFSHNRPGQNMWGGGQLGNDLTAAIGAFLAESVHYDFASNACTNNLECHHFTQVVWALTNGVGCAYHNCPSATYLVCNYNPYGNYVGAPVYLAGPPCSACASGSGWCNNGLCMDSACTAASSTCTCNRQCANSCGTFNATSCQCVCQPGWTGNDCSISTCLNGVVTKGTCGCQCNKGWVGVNCDQACVNIPGSTCYKSLCTSTVPYWQNYMQTRCPLTCPGGPCTATATAG